MNRVSLLSLICVVPALFVSAGMQMSAQAVAPGSSLRAEDAGQAVHVILTAGHRNNDRKSTGAAGEAALTGRYADAYADQLVAAGFKVYYIQRLDDDNRPDWYSGNLSQVAQRVASLGQSLGTTDPIVMLDVHMEAPSRAAGVFVIIPDGVGLGPALVPPDNWENNARSRALARSISERISEATGIPIRTARARGIMSEQQTNVALTSRSRLAMFRSTAPIRNRMERLVVEHGNLRMDSVRLHNPATPGKVARSVTAALLDFYGVQSRPGSPSSGGSSSPVARPAPLPATTPPVRYASPGVRPPLDGFDHVLNGVDFVAARRRVRIARDGVPVLRYADAGSAPVAPPLRRGEVVEVAFFVRGAPYDGDNRWWIRLDGARIPMAGTVEKLQRN